MEQILASDLQKKIEQNEKLEIIDVREDFEVQFGGMVPGAKNIPLQQLLNQLDQLDKDKQYILICRSGNRSGMACQFMEMRGFNTVNVMDGMLGWSGPLE